jgi:hypothetical protein
MLPGGGPDDYVMWPMAYGYNVPFFFGQQMGSVIRGKTPPLTAAGNIAGAFYDSFNPVGGTRSFWQTVSPTFLDPGVQMLENKTWYGGPIYPTKFDKKMPDSELFFSSVPERFVAAARALNRATGGSEGRPGSIDISPATLNHYFEFITGGAGKFLIRSWDTGERLFSEDEWLPEQTPFLRRVYGKSTSVSLRREFYAAWDQVDQAHYEVKKLRKINDTETISKRKQQYALELRAHGAMKAAVKSLRKMRKSRIAVEKNETLSAIERKERVELIKEREDALIKGALKAYNEMKQGAKND